MPVSIQAQKPKTDVAKVKWDELLITMQALNLHFMIADMEQQIWKH